MAWEEIKRLGETIMTGDKPIDEMAFALKKLTKAYEDRFDRKPLLSEVLYAFEISLTSTPDLYVSDPEEINRQHKLFGRTN